MLLGNGNLHKRGSVGRAASYVGLVPSVPNGFLPYAIATTGSNSLIIRSEPTGSSQIPAGRMLASLYSRSLSFRLTATTALRKIAQRNTAQRTTAIRIESPQIHCSTTPERSLPVVLLKPMHFITSNPIPTYTTTNCTDSDEGHD